MGLTCCAARLASDVKAFHDNMEHSLPVRLVRKVPSENPTRDSYYAYVYCGKYEVRQECAPCNCYVTLLSLLLFDAAMKFLMRKMA